MQRGLTQVVGQTNRTALIGETVSYNVGEDFARSLYDNNNVANVYNSSNSKTEKQVDTVDSYELNYRCDLPDGITFDTQSGLIEGTFTYSQLARIDIIANVTFIDGTVGKIAYKYVIDVKPYYDNDESVVIVDPPVDNPNENNGDDNNENNNENNDDNNNNDKPIVIKKDGCKLSVGAASAFISSLTLVGALLIVLNKKRNK